MFGVISEVLKWYFLIDGWKVGAVGVEDCPSPFNGTNPITIGTRAVSWSKSNWIKLFISSMGHVFAGIEAAMLGTVRLPCHVSVEFAATSPFGMLTSIIGLLWTSGAILLPFTGILVMCEINLTFTSLHFDPFLLVMFTLNGMVSPGTYPPLSKVKN